MAKCDKSLLQNSPPFLLQNTTVILQNATSAAFMRLFFRVRRLSRLNNLVTSIKRLGTLLDE